MAGAERARSVRSDQGGVGSVGSRRSLEHPALASDACTECNEPEVSRHGQLLLETIPLPGDARSGRKLAHVDETERRSRGSCPILRAAHRGPGHTPASGRRAVKTHCSCVGLLAMLACLAFPPRLVAQSTTGTIQGTVSDEQEAVVPGATVTIRNVATNAVRTAVSEKNGFYRFLNLPVGEYELTIEKGGFAKYVRSGITVSLNQDAVVDVQLQRAGLTESIEVRADAPLINRTTPEVGVRFDTTRIAELPVQGATFRDVFALALSAPGVSALGSGQARFASGTNFSANGMRVRSNNFTIDGQDNNVSRSPDGSSRSTTPTSSRRSA